MLRPKRLRVKAVPSRYIIRYACQYYSASTCTKTTSRIIQQSEFVDIPRTNLLREPAFGFRVNNM